ncbi:hypothetical protein N665_1215s0015 [Sinapis alba]|nr:hypothetical protein N665_1215s0015 [Sinapis alba]
MWTVKPAPIPVQSFRGPTGLISVGYSHPPPRNDDGIHRRNIPRKSQILLRSGESNPNPNKPVPNEKEISGSDVLLAIQRATAQRKRSNADKSKKIRGVELASTAGESTGDNGVDYSNVRPLVIKSDWGHRLDEFEKLLKEFQDMEL